MKPARFQYHRPTQLHEALEMVATLQNYKILAGGQSLMPMMNFRFVMPDHVIDMNRVSELSGIHEDPGRLVIGAMTRQHDIHRSALVAKLCPLVPEAYDQVSHRQIRNRGTLGGSLCHLDPASEQPCFTSALDGEIQVQSLKGQRTISIHDWTQMYMTPALESDEIMTRVTLKPWAQNHGWSFLEYARRHGDYAIVGVAVLVALDASQQIERVSISLCGVAAAPLRLSALESSLLGQRGVDRIFPEVHQHIEAIEEIMHDSYNSSTYRRHLAQTLTARALGIALKRALMVH
jgi:carbon-monoxide dehydrogenase medium subunit